MTDLVDRSIPEAKGERCAFTRAYLRTCLRRPVGRVGRCQVRLQ